MTVASPVATSLSIGQVADAAAVNVQTLRYYERVGLVPAPKRSRAGYRMYGEETVRVVSFVKRAQELGFTLKEIKELLKFRTAGLQKREAVRAAATAKVANIDARIQDLTSIRAALSREFGALLPDDDEALPGAGPARYLRVRYGGGTDGVEPTDGTRRVGIISAVTEPFCETCNRVRLSATGQLHTCLARDEASDLRAVLRAVHPSGTLRPDLIAAVRAAAAGKQKGHEFTEGGCGGPRKHMVSIGG